MADNDVTMPSSEPPVELLRFLGAYPEDIQQLFVEVRQLVAAKVAGASEFVVDASNATCTGFSYTSSFMQGFIHIAAYSDHVNLGFNSGVLLQDTCGKLSGTGSMTRHVSLFRREELSDPALADLIDEAINLAYRPSAPLAEKLVIKEFSGSKVRPRLY